MNIAVVGLGLIGGSLCKALKKHTFHNVFGIDSNENTIKSALECGAIDKEITVNELSECNLAIICLYPESIVEFVENNAEYFKKDSLVIDTCGIKGFITDRCVPVLREKSVHFIGCHPMAGREFSGFEYSLDTLFDKASFIITPTEDTPQMAVDLLATLAGSIGFGKVVVSTPEEHDRIIAYTSQLAHVVSNAYVKSPSIENFNGFSAGSFQDLTRVAKLNEFMWTELFLCNKNALLSELDCIIDHLNQYKTAIETSDREKLIEILRDGRIRKEESTEREKR